jgi:hypothetical protein
MRIGGGGVSPPPPYRKMDYYEQLAEALFDHINDRLVQTPIVAKIFTQKVDESDVSAASEVIDSIHLSEFAAAMGGDYSTARMTLNALNNNFNIFVSSCSYAPQTEEQIKNRVREIFLGTVGKVLKQLDN